MGRALKILVVDDDLGFRSSVAASLELEKYDVETVASAREALQRIGSECFDVALVDLMMPGVHGLDLARRFKALCPNVHVVLTSAFHLSSQQLVHADCGAEAFLPKPYGADRILSYLNRVRAASC
jgi:CheY-like chemotaxis protein